MRYFILDNQLRDLYQEVILEHSRAPYNHYPLSEPYKKAIGNNPLCGDHLVIYVRHEEGILSALSFEGQGCAICMASASLMIQTLQKKPLTLFYKLFAQFQQLITKPITESIEAEELGKLQVVLGVRAFPMRVKCATLAWHTLNNAIKNTSTVAMTE